MCEHPQINWIGKSDGIHCGICGQLINFGTPKIQPKKEEPKPEIMPEPVEDPAPTTEPEEPKPKRKAAPKKGTKK